MADINSHIEIGVTTGPIRGSRKVHVGPLKVAMRDVRRLEAHDVELGHRQKLLPEARPQTLRLDQDAQGFDFGGIAKAVEHDVRTLFGQSSGDGQPDAAGRAGDECGFAR